MLLQNHRCIYIDCVISITIRAIKYVYILVAFPVTVTIGTLESAE